VLGITRQREAAADDWPRAHCGRVAGDVVRITTREDNRVSQAGSWGIKVGPTFTLPTFIESDKASFA
jgi:hypothetical protein